jgi:hypothetical protein
VHNQLTILTYWTQDVDWPAMYMCLHKQAAWKLTQHSGKQRVI